MMLSLSRRCLYPRQKGLFGLISCRWYSSPPKVDYPPSVLQLQVGKIVHCQNHPNSNFLYVANVLVNDVEKAKLEEIKKDLQALKPDELEVNNMDVITILTGLVDIVPLEEMIDRNIIVLKNLKPRVLRGIKSNGMLLATEVSKLAENKSESESEVKKDWSNVKVEPIYPPLSSNLGDELFFKPFVRDENEPIKSLRGRSTLVKSVFAKFRINNDHKFIYKHDDTEIPLTSLHDDNSSAYTKDIKNSIVH
ncbi:nucleic acid-binding protein [Ascoidea rubescens DSM 1968]|uniref:Nucleic acid-binding protein n=1 Tax=Ascoidea rubescens DSM 1968 TaxID=1344418 RepID=A0A1D2VMP5_9ASCO|nr:nucleic acid-binding protein [Ascoidea rubescens DSM 1968]ODV62882.1 nucleic acid-binding protein [Ascoidea rubescens DSM 1968]